MKNILSGQFISYTGLIRSNEGEFWLKLLKGGMFLLFCPSHLKVCFYPKLPCLLLMKKKIAEKICNDFSLKKIKNVNWTNKYFPSTK